MRPSASTTGEELYECFDCGKRQRSVEGRTCEECGGTLRNITRSRDL
jgi:rRNA maturation endonuclease Nob1